MIPHKLDYTIEITKTKLKEKTIYSKISDHKWFISERLGRDVGFWVAATDYIFNIHKLPSMPTTAN